MRPQASVRALWTAQVGLPKACSQASLGSAGWPKRFCSHRRGCPDGQAPRAEEDATGGTPDLSRDASVPGCEDES